MREKSGGTKCSGCESKVVVPFDHLSYHFMGQKLRDGGFCFF